MADRQSEEPNRETIVVRQMSWGRIASFVALGILILFAIAIALVWIQRRPIATEFLKREFERRGVPAEWLAFS